MKCSPPPPSRRSWDTMPTLLSLQDEEVQSIKKNGWPCIRLRELEEFWECQHLWGAKKTEGEPPGPTNTMI